MGRIVEAIQLPDAWLDAVLGKINLQDETKRVGEKRLQVTDRLKRLGRAYVDGMVSEGDYDREKQYLEMELEILVVRRCVIPNIVPLGFDRGKRSCTTTYKGIENNFPFVCVELYTTFR